MAIEIGNELYMRIIHQSLRFMNGLMHRNIKKTHYWCVLNWLIWKSDCHVNMYGNKNTQPKNPPKKQKYPPPTPKKNIKNKLSWTCIYNDIKLKFLFKCLSPSFSTYLPFTVFQHKTTLRCKKIVIVNNKYFIFSLNSIV